MYILKFQPILKSILWGGDAISRFKQMETPLDGIGESWEISGVAGDLSVVANGAMQGETLHSLMLRYGADLLGESVFQRYGATFPLLIKFIDARQALSVQVHPDNDLAFRRHQSFGKTEMWYVVKATDEAYLYAGFRAPFSAEQYLQSLADDTFIQYLQRYEVSEGDVFFLPAGCVHAIGAGCFIAEIQQTSNITYRIYDYRRKDAQGNQRELHTELAKDAICYDAAYRAKIDYDKTSADAVQELVSCPYFTTQRVEVGQTAVELQFSGESFVILMGLEGTCFVSDSTQQSIALSRGETLLVPACISQNIRIRSDNRCRLLSVTSCTQTAHSRSQ